MVSTEQDEEHHAHGPHVHSGAQPLAVAALTGLARVRVWVGPGAGLWVRVRGRGSGALELTMALIISGGM